jgi:hypothetical protein
MSPIVRSGLVVLLTLCGTHATAQTELGAITGTVKDPQGGVLPGVTASAVNVATNVTTTAVTNQDGIYLLNALVNGTYRVTFTIAGASCAASPSRSTCRSSRPCA